MSVTTTKTLSKAEDAARINHVTARAAAEKERWQFVAGRHNGGLSSTLHDWRAIRILAIAHNVEAISAEAVTTSEIEGEILDRASVQSSIRRQLGLETEGEPDQYFELSQLAD